MQVFVSHRDLTLKDWRLLHLSQLPIPLNFSGLNYLMSLLSFKGSGRKYGFAHVFSIGKTLRVF